MAARAEAGKRHVPLRRCVHCRRSLPQGRPQGGLLRLVSGDEGYVLDSERRLGGRGAWLCRDCAASLIAGNENSKQVRRTFGAQADRVRELLSAALGTDPARRTAVPGSEDGGVDVG